MTKGGDDEEWEALGARIRACGCEVSEVALDELTAVAEHAESEAALATTTSGLQGAPPPAEYTPCHLKFSVS